MLAHRLSQVAFVSFSIVVWFVELTITVCIRLSKFGLLKAICTVATMSPDAFPD